jgi:hypothetical protein
MEFLNWSTYDLDIKAKSATFYKEQHRDLYILEAFQQGRCAICGHEDKIVMDHCHESGFIRGLLCQSCNIREGTSDHATYRAYRHIYPTKMLGLKILYRDYSQLGSPAHFRESELDVNKWSDDYCYKVIRESTRSGLTTLDWLDSQEYLRVLSKALDHAIVIGAESGKNG